MGGEGAEDLPAVGRRRPVRRQVPCARRARHPCSAPCRLVPRGHRRELLGRPQHQGQDHARRHLPGGAGEESGTLPAQGGPGHVARRGHRPRRRHGQGARHPDQVPHQDASEPQGHADRGPRHRPCPHQADARRGQAHAGIFQEASGLLRRSGQDAQRHGFGFVRPHHGRAYGPLCRPLPEARRVVGDGRQGQPFAGGHRRLQGQRRLLPRFYRRSRGYSGQEFHQVGRGGRLPRVGHGGRAQDLRRGLPRLHHRR